MIRCDNDDCPMSRECYTYLIFPTDADGVKRFEPKNDKECDYLIELATYPDNEN